MGILISVKGFKVVERRVIRISNLKVRNYSACDRNKISISSVNTFLLKLKLWIDGLIYINGRLLYVFIGLYIELNFIRF